jgi:hypothetical protein
MIRGGALENRADRYGYRQIRIFEIGFDGDVDLVLEGALLRGERRTEADGDLHHGRLLLELRAFGEGGSSKDPLEVGVSHAVACGRHGGIVLLRCPRRRDEKRCPAKDALVFDGEDDSSVSSRHGPGVDSWCRNGRRKGRATAADQQEDDRGDAGPSVRSLASPVFCVLCESQETVELAWVHRTKPVGRGALIEQCLHVHARTFRHGHASSSPSTCPVLA